MNLVIVIAGLTCLIVLITAARVNAFLAFLIVSLGLGVALGIPAGKVAGSIEKGMGDLLGSNLFIIIAGAMLGKLIAITGAAQQIADSIVQRTGLKNIHWAVALVGFVVGIPLYYGTGFVLLVPMLLSLCYQYKLPVVATGVSMLAALSVAHGFLPPHPSPVALVSQFGGDIATTLMYGLVIAIPAIVLAGPIFSRLLKHIQAAPTPAFTPAMPDRKPGVSVSFLTALLPLILFAFTAILPPGATGNFTSSLQFISQPLVIMLFSLIAASWLLGIREGYSIKYVMDIYGVAVAEIAMIVLIIAGAGALKQVLTDSGVNIEIADALQRIPLPPLFLGWLTAALIRAAVGSATVAGFTAAGVVLPLLQQTNTNPNLMVLAIGAGSLMFSHVNDAGFWMFKEYFNVSVRDTFKSWSVMEIIVSVAGLIGVLLLNFVVQ